MMNLEQIQYYGLECLELAQNVILNESVKLLGSAERWEFRYHSTLLLAYQKYLFCAAVAYIPYFEKKK
jgi:hypothetical protein